ncbi:MAG: alpha/beta hydrolase [Candidatus Nomurabacteria bacterium]|jgi:pimeloyl-ACP methyl ester carboxylesterase|nr:alpha/beta hydrolase [Candidatus Nomurabacteria bacterium]
MKLVVDGLMTEYIDRGKGKVILFLHGWGSDAAVFGGLFKELEDKYRVIGLNFPGFGGTDEPPEVWSVQDYVDFTKKFIDKLDLKDIYAIVGHSFGGRVMLKSVSSGQIAAKKLIFIDTAGVKQKTTLKLFVYKAIAKTGKVIFGLPGLKKFSGKLKDRLYGAAGAKDYVNATSEVMKEIFKKVIDEDLSQDIAKIKQPSLVVWGADDEMTPASDLEEYGKNRVMQVNIIDDAGHYVFIDQPEKTIKLIKEFL